MKLLVILSSTAMLTACGLTSPKSTTMDFNDLNYMSTGCRQEATIRQQLANVPFWDRPKRAILHNDLLMLRGSCDPRRNIKPADCVVVQENFNGTASQARVCNDGTRPGQYINRWELEFDKQR
jgi:hypothetical protein